MWKDYSKSYIKNNRASGVSVMVAAFISALLLSLLCSLFYNFWAYEIERLKKEEGDWHSRMIGEIHEEDLITIQNYASVEKVVVNTDVPVGLPDPAFSKEDGGTSYGREVAVDIYFADMKRVFADTPRIIELLSQEPETVDYHYSLLAMYLVRDESDTAPRAIFPFLLAMTVMASVSLIMIIHNAFAASMGGRVHQVGILSSIGATPGQIRTCLIQEAAILCAVPIMAGNLLGILVSMGVIEGMNWLAADVPGRIKAEWTYHPLLFGATLLVTVFTIWISAWIPARKMSRLTPLEAIRNTGELCLKRKRNSHILAHLFGAEGELAGNALWAQRKSLRTASLALLVSFSAFFLMQCFFTLTLISQQMTYYARYQDAWDIMVTVKDTQAEDFGEADRLRDLTGVRSAVVYQKAAAKRLLSGEELSDALLAEGGLGGAPAEYVAELSEGWMVNVPVVVLDDVGFLEYCRQIGAPQRTDGAVILNRINDSKSPNFRIRNYIPYLKEDLQTSSLVSNDDENVNIEIPVLFYTQQPPVLKEAYDELDQYVLVHILPVSLWREVKGQAGKVEENTYIRVLGEEGVTLAELNKMEEEILGIVGEKYEAESVNRIQDRITNDQMINGMMTVFGGFCVLLAIIGIGNVFSNTLGFVYQRKREFARYQSIGLTPEGLRKMFCIEALVIAGKPVLTALPVTAVVIGMMIKASYLEPMVFIREMPVIPMLAFTLAVFGFVALAYYLGGRRVLGSSLVDALKDDKTY